ncbi:MAG: SGNH/GDSL hydrolase family protein, partial [Pseudomonadota bacterium]
AVIRHWLAAMCVGTALGAAGPAHALAFDSLIIFGDSLSDSGNNSIVFDNAPASMLPTPVPPNLRTPVPIPNEFTGFGLVPTYPYATKTFTPNVPFDRYTNGFVWAELFAGRFGLTALPSLFPGIPNVLPPGTNFAFAGARTGPAGSGFPFSLTDQVAFFQAGLQGNPAPATALYVVEGGGNNARDTINQVIGALLGGATPQQIQLLVDAAALSYGKDMQGILSQLQGLNVVVWNVPDAGRAPATLAGAQLLDPLFMTRLGTTFPDFATDIVEAMNEELMKVLAGFGGVHLFDIFGLVNDIANDPLAFGLLNANLPCAALPVCNPASFLFWDGIHPTSAGHAIVANAMIALLVPEPSSVALLLAAALGLISLRRRSFTAC